MHFCFVLNYIKFVQTLIEMKMETLKTHEFHIWSRDRPDTGKHAQYRH